MLKVLITDDHPIVREGVKRLIEGQFESAHVEEAEQGRDAIEKLRRHEWDILILDINLPDRNGLDVLKEARALNASLPIIMLSVYTEDQYAIRAYKAGANAYLNKRLAPYELIKAMQTVRTGQKYISPSMTYNVIVSQQTKEPLTPHDSLSDRELEVLCLFVNGKSTKEIGSMMAISEKTVSTYRSRMLAKLHLRTTVDLIRFAIDHKLGEQA